MCVSRVEGLEKRGRGGKGVEQKVGEGGGKGGGTYSFFSSAPVLPPLPLPLPLPLVSMVLLMLMHLCL